jgi:hypothetical protein
MLVYHIKKVHMNEFGKIINVKIKKDLDHVGGIVFIWANIKIKKDFDHVSGIVVIWAISEI